MCIKLTAGEVKLLREVANGCHGRGGFQNLLLQLWYRVDDDSGELVVPRLLLERIYRYAFQYKNTTWRKTLRKVFRRTLGANLDRGLIRT